MTEDKRFTYSDVWGWNIDGFLNTMNGLDRKNNELKERVKELESCNRGLAQKQHRKLTKIIELERELNEKDEQIKELEARNKRQYYSLKKIFDLMYARDWKALESIVEDWEEFDKLLQEIHRCFEKENGDAE